MKKIFALMFLISIILALSLIGLRNLEKNKGYQGKAILVIRTLGNTTQEEADIQGLNALDILNKNHNVRILPAITSRRINCIDDVCAKKGFWWKFFVNNKPVLRSVDKYYPKDGDVLLLEYGEVE